MTDEDCRTLYVGNLHSDVTEELLYELFLQAGPVQYVKIPTDRSTKIAKNFGFICFKNEESVPYGYYLLDKVQLFGKYLKVQPRNRDMEIPAVEDVGIHTLEPQEDNKNNEYPKFSNNLPRSGNPYENNAMVVAQSFAGNIQVNQAGFPIASQANNSLLGYPTASQANNSLLGYPPFAPPPALNALLFPTGFGVPAVDTNYMNSFKNNYNQDNYNQSNSNRYQNNGHKDNNKSRFNGRLEFSNNSKNYDYQQNDRFDRNHGSGQNYRGSYNNKEYGGGGHNRRGSYDDREYRGGHNRRDSYNDSSRNNNNNRSDGSSSGRYHNSYNNRDDGSSSSSSRHHNSSGRQNNYQSRY